MVDTERKPGPNQHASGADVQRRIDQLLVERGFFESRAKARAAIEAGLVVADGRLIDKPSALVAFDASLAAAAAHPWVSRGGVKLAAALDAFAIDPSGRVCLDIGTSTGGFTDVLLARGAARVYAVDVGRGQLHPKLAGDPRVVSREATDARRLMEDPPAEPVGLVTMDLSFISVRLVLPALLPLISEGCELVVLVKPQFEAGRERVGRGGIVRDDSVREAVAGEVKDAIAALGFAILGLIPSPIAGGDGNREFLLGARRLG
jgi:23S rRNA (cytidine1920-2'-O)/16S rRNA (cytidine1409-2'-O)-methyltransferase